MKRAITHTLDRACTWVDRLWNWPLPFRWIARWLGCPSGLALWAARLDERWRTGLYEDTRSDQPNG